MWLDSSYPDVSVEDPILLTDAVLILQQIGNDPFDLAVGLDDVWDESGFPLPGFPNC